MNTYDPEDSPPTRPTRTGSRVGPIVMLVVAAIFVVCHIVIMQEHRFFPAAVVLVPALVLTGIAGLIEPRVALAVSPKAKELDLPRWARILGPLLMVTGMAAGAWYALVNL